MTQLVQLSYVSTARELLTNKQLESLLKDSSKSNKEHGITGMLLYKYSTFMQVIEGLESDIDHLFLNIMDDITHTGVTRLFKDKIPKRDFSEWSMGFKRSSSEKLDGFSEFMSLKNECTIPSGKAKILLLGFK